MKIIACVKSSKTFDIISISWVVLPFKYIFTSLEVRSPWYITAPPVDSPLGVKHQLSTTQSRSPSSYLWHKINYISQWRLVSVSVRGRHAVTKTVLKHVTLLTCTETERIMTGTVAGKGEAGRRGGGGGGGERERVSGSSVQSDPQKTEEAVWRLPWTTARTTGPYHWVSESFSLSGGPQWPGLTVQPRHWVARSNSVTVYSANCRLFQLLCGSVTRTMSVAQLLPRNKWSKGRRVVPATGWAQRPPAESLPLSWSAALGSVTEWGPGGTDHLPPQSWLSRLDPQMVIQFRFVRVQLTSSSGLCMHHKMFAAERLRH